MLDSEILDHPTRRAIFFYMKIRRYATIDVLQEKIFEERGEPITRQGVIWSIARLNEIIAHRNEHIQKISGVGRGKKGRYKFLRLDQVNKSQTSERLNKTIPEKIYEPF